MRNAISKETCDPNRKRPSFVVCFDGYCLLCNKWVDLLIRLDKGNVFSFSPLQSDATKSFLGDKCYVDLESEALNTVVVVNKGQLSIKSDAVIEIIYGLGGVYRTAIVLKLVPRILRDFLYDFVANRRLRWFGRRDTCRVPSESESFRFLE